MSDKQEGSAGGLSFAGWPAPVPSSTQPADTLRAPPESIQSVSALADNKGTESQQIARAYIALRTAQLAEEARVMAWQANNCRQGLNKRSPAQRAAYARQIVALEAEVVLRANAIELYAERGQQA